MTAILLSSLIYILLVVVHSVHSYEKQQSLIKDPVLCTVEDSDLITTYYEMIDLAVDKAQVRLYTVANFSLNRTFITTEDVFQFIKNGCRLLSSRCVAVLSLVKCPLINSMDYWAGQHSIPHLVYSSGADNCRAQTTNSLQLSPASSVHSQVLKKLIQNIWGWREVVFLFDEFLEPETRLEISLMLSDISVTSCSIRIDQHTTNETLYNILNVVADMRHVLVAVKSYMLPIIFQQASGRDLFSRFFKWVVLSNTSCYEALNNSLLLNSNLLYLRYIHLDMNNVQQTCDVTSTTLEEDIDSRIHLLSAGMEAMFRALATEDLLVEWSESSESICDEHLALRRQKTMYQTKKSEVVTPEGRVTFDPITGRVSSFGFEFCSSDNMSPKGFSSLGSWSPTSIDTMKRDTNLFKNAFGDFRGQTLLIGSMEAPPFIFKKKRENETIFEGFCISILQELAVRLNFSYRIIEPSDKLWGAPVGNGSWNGLIGMVIRGDLNFIIGPLTITSSRASVIDFTTPYMEDGSGILTKKPDPDSETVSGFFRLFKAMKPKVWACLAASVIAVSLVIYLVSQWSPISEETGTSRNESSLTWFNSFWASLGSILGQGSEYQPVSSSGRIILGFWWIFTIILVSTYTANMTAVLTITIYEQPINSIVELSSQSQVKPLVKLGTNLYTLFEEAKDSIYTAIWKMMSSDGVKARTNQEALALVKTGKYAFITDRSQLEYIVKNECETYALAEDVFNTAGMGFVLPKNAEFLTSIDSIIMKLKESGIIDGWRRQWWTGSGNKCSDLDRVSTVNQLDLKYLAGPFIVLLTAMAVSILVIIIEKSYLVIKSWMKDETKK